MNVIATNATIQKENEITFDWFYEQSIVDFYLNDVQMFEVRFKENEVSKIKIAYDFDKLDLETKTNLIIEAKKEIGERKEIEFKFLNPVPDLALILDKKIIERPELEWIISRQNITFPYFAKDTQTKTYLKFKSPTEVVKFTELWDTNNKMKATCEIVLIEEDMFQLNPTIVLLEEFKDLVKGMFEPVKESDFDNLKNRFLGL